MPKKPEAYVGYCYDKHRHSSVFLIFRKLQRVCLRHEIVTLVSVKKDDISEFIKHILKYKHHHAWKFIHPRKEIPIYSKRMKSDKLRPLTRAWRIRLDQAIKAKKST